MEVEPEVDRKGGEDPFLALRRQPEEAVRHRRHGHADDGTEQQDGEVAALPQQLGGVGQRAAGCGVVRRLPWVRSRRCSRSSLRLVTVLRLAPGAAGAGLVTTCGCEDSVDLVGETSGAESVGHQAHDAVDVGEERLVAGAQVVEAFVAVRSECEPVLRTFTIACEPHLAVEAVPPGSRSRLASPKRRCCGDATVRPCVSYGCCRAGGRLHEMVTGVQVTVVFERDGVAAGLGEHAHRARNPEPRRQRGVERGWTYTEPTSRETHSSNTAIRNLPHASGSTERSVTVSPSWNPVSFSRSTMGISWMRRSPRSSRKNR